MRNCFGGNSELFRRGGSNMSYIESAESAGRAADAAREAGKSTDDPIHKGLAEAIALLADAVKEMAESHHRQF